MTFRSQGARMLDRTLHGEAPGNGRTEAEAKRAERQRAAARAGKTYPSVQSARCSGCRCAVLVAFHRANGGRCGVCVRRSGDLIRFVMVPR